MKRPKGRKNEKGNGRIGEAGRGDERVHEARRVVDIAYEELTGIIMRVTEEVVGVKCGGRGKEWI